MLNGGEKEFLRSLGCFDPRLAKKVFVSHCRKHNGKSHGKELKRREKQQHMGHPRDRHQR